MRTMGVWQEKGKWEPVEEMMWEMSQNSLDTKRVFSVQLFSEAKTI